MVHCVDALDWSPPRMEGLPGLVMIEDGILWGVGLEIVKIRHPIA